eukprot:jgi/Botrbrau1/5048/Bobra.37_1s0014.1
MSNGRLKAATNRVRTSIALQANSMWTNTIGQAPDAQAGSNSAIEAALNAPTHGGGRKARQQAAANVVAQTDGFNTAVHSYESLLVLARSQGAVGGQNRGACKVCGQLGHLTKQCRNMQSSFFKPPADAAAGGTTNGKGVSAEALEAARANLLVLPDITSDLESDLSDSDSSSSSSDSEDERRRKEKKRKRKERKRAAEKRKRKKEKKHKKKRRKKSKSSSSSSSDSD